MHDFWTEHGMGEGSLASLARKGEKEWGVGGRAGERAWLMRVFFFYKRGCLFYKVFDFSEGNIVIIHHNEDVKHLKSNEMKNQWKTSLKEK